MPTKAQLTEELGLLRIAFEDLIARHHQLQEENAQFHRNEERIQELESEKHALKTEVAAWPPHRLALERVAQLESEITGLRTSNAGYEAAVTNYKAEIVARSRRQADLINEVTSRDTRIEELEQTKKDLVDTLSQKELIIHSLQERWSDFLKSATVPAEEVPIEKLMGGITVPGERVQFSGVVEEAEYVDSYTRIKMKVVASDGRYIYSSHSAAQTHGTPARAIGSSLSTTVYVHEIHFPEEVIPQPVEVFVTSVDGPAEEVQELDSRYVTWDKLANVYQWAFEQEGERFAWEDFVQALRNQAKD